MAKEVYFTTNFVPAIKTGRVETEYMTFILETQKPKTTVWRVINTKSGFTLGRISWLSGWRQYVIDTEPGCTFNNACLADIVSILNGLNKLQEENKK